MLNEEYLLDRRRIFFIASGIVVIFLIIIVRVVDIQIINARRYISQADLQQIRQLEIPAKRGLIFVQDNNNQYPIAMNQSLKFLFADPYLMQDLEPTEIANKLAPIIQYNANDLANKLTYKGNRYVILKQQIDQTLASKIEALKIPGLVLVDKDYRFYPEGSLFGQITGFINRELSPQYGLEEFYNNILAGKNGILKSKTDSFGAPIYSDDNVLYEPINGSNISLTIDRPLQIIANRIADETIKQNNADGVSIIVEDPKSGAIKALVNRPDFNPNEYYNSNVANYQNVAVSNQFEPGSGFKAITMVSALDAGKVKEDTTFVDSGSEIIDGRTIRNALNNTFGLQNMTGVIVNSINTGMVFVLKQMGVDPSKITLSGKQLFYGYIQKFGFGNKTNVDLYGEIAGSVKDPNSAADVDYANMTFGQGIAVTSLQLTNAFAAIANGGTLYQPYVVSSIINGDKTEVIKPKSLRQVVSKESTDIIKKMLVGVVQKGSGYSARIPGYGVAGKTGTAQVPLPDGSGYDPNKNIGSFTGFFPVNDPKFVIHVKVENPRVGGFAESTAVPAFASLAKEMISLYQIPPSP